MPYKRTWSREVRGFDGKAYATGTVAWASTNDDRGQHPTGPRGRDRLALKAIDCSMRRRCLSGLIGEEMVPLHFRMLFSFISVWGATFSRIPKRYFQNLIFWIDCCSLCVL